MLIPHELSSMDRDWYRARSSMIRSRKARDVIWVFSVHSAVLMNFGAAYGRRGPLVIGSAPYLSAYPMPIYLRQPRIAAAFDEARVGGAVRARGLRVSV